MNTTAEVGVSDQQDLTIGDVAHRLGVSRWAVTRLIKSDELVAVRVPGRGRDGAKRIPPTSYTQLIHRHTIPADRDGAIEVSTGLPALHPFAGVAEKYGISLRSLTDTARARKFAHTRIGSKRYFTDAQLAAYLADREISAEQADDPLAAVRARVARRRSRTTTGNTAA